MLPRRKRSKKKNDEKEKVYKNDLEKNDTQWFKFELPLNRVYDFPDYQGPTTSSELTKHLEHPSFPLQKVREQLLNGFN